jgi:hypothetical protein
MSPIDCTFEEWLENSPISNKELVLKWITALESGEYSQTTACLRDFRGFCCLGVLCDVYDSNMWVTAIAYKYSYKGHTTLLPPEISKACSIAGEGAPALATAFVSLVDLNDHHNYTFKQIAQVIRKYPHKILDNLS